MLMMMGGDNMENWTSLQLNSLKEEKKNDKNNQKKL